MCVRVCVLHSTARQYTHVLVDFQTILLMDLHGYGPETATTRMTRLSLSKMHTSHIRQGLCPSAQHFFETHTHTHPFNGPLSRTTQVGRYQKGKTNLDFTTARDSEWQWHQLGQMQVCTSLQTDNHASTPPLGFFTDWVHFLLPNQQRQSTEGKFL